MAKQANKDLFLEVKRMFDPIKMLKYLSKDTNGVVYLDKKKMSYLDEDLSINNGWDLFETYLNYFYRWDYEDIENTTIYFDIRDFGLIGGLYNLATKEKTNTKMIASIYEPNKLYDNYAYYYEEFISINKAILDL